MKVSNWMRSTAAAAGAVMIFASGAAPTMAASAVQTLVLRQADFDDAGDHAVADATGESTDATVWDSSTGDSGGADSST